MAAPVYVQESEVPSWASNALRSGNAFAVVANDRVVRLSGAEGPTPGMAFTASYVTMVDGASFTGASAGSVYVATGTAGGSGNHTDTLNSSGGGGNWLGWNSLTFRNSDGFGTPVASAAKGAGTISVTTTQANSAIAVIVVDYDAGVEGSWNSSAGTPIELSSFRDAAHYTVQVAYYPDVGAAGAKTVGITGGTGRTVGAVEIKGTAAGGGGLTISSAGSAVVTGYAPSRPTFRTVASAGTAVVTGYAPTRAVLQTISSAGSAVVTGYAPSRPTFRTVASAGAAIVAGQVPTLSPDVTLSWDAPAGWTPTEYRVKLGTTSGSYTTTLPDVATTSTDVYNIQYNVRYFWVVYGLDAGDVEQLVSGEAWFEVFMPPAGSAVVTGYSPSIPTLRTVASAGTAVVSGYAPSRSQGNARVISAAGAAVVSGYAPARSVAFSLQSVGSAVATGYPPTLGLTRTLASAGSAVVTGYAPSRTISLTIATAATAVVTGYAPSRTNAPLTISAAGSAVVTGHTPALAKLFTAAAAAQAVVSGYAPSRGVSLQIAAAGSAVVTGYAPTRPTVRTIISAGAAVVSGYAANLTQGNVRTIGAAGSAAVAGYTPTRSIAITLQTSGSAVVTGYAPVFGVARVIAATGTALCAGYAPTRLISLSIHDAGNALVTGYAPSMGSIIDLMDQIIADLALTELSAADQRFLSRKLAAILAAIKRITGRDIEPKTWREKHSPTQGGVILISNPPIRELLSPQDADHDPDTGLVCVGTTDDVVVEYAGGYAEMPADLYDAIISLMGQAWSQRSGGGGMAAVPGVKSMSLFDVGSVQFTDGNNADAVLGAYADIFRYYACPAAHIGISTLDRAETI